MKKSLSIGRSRDNDIVLGQAQVSDRHATLKLVTVDPPRFLLRDIGSVNGTFVGGQRIAEAEIGPGDAVLIANVALQADSYLPLFGLGSSVAGFAEKREAMAGAGNSAIKRIRRSAIPSTVACRSTLDFLIPTTLFLLTALGIYVFNDPALTIDNWRSHSISFARLAGALIVSGILVQLGLVLVNRKRRLNYERRQQALILDLWETKLKSAKRRQTLKEKQVPEGWKGLRKFEVAQKVAEGGGIASFYLVPHDGKPLPSFKPGQYLTFNLKVPTESRPLVRCYSLSSAAAKLDYYRITIKRVPPPRDHPELPPGKSSSYLHDLVKEGDILDVLAPRGHFFLDADSDHPIVLIAGGVGITPLLSMLDTVVDYGQHRELWFFYGVRNSQEQILSEHLKTIAQEHPNIHLQVCYSNPLEEDIEGAHYQHAERVSVALMKRLLPANNYDFYICGPPPMMDSITADLEAWGVSKAHIHFEAFGPASVQQVSHASGSAQPASGEYEVEFSKSAKTCHWTAESGSLLELAEANGVTIDFGCRSGNCGTCVLAIREGKVDYINEPGAEVEEGSCLACVARPSGESGKDRLIVDA